MTQEQLYDELDDIDSSQSEIPEMSDIFPSTNEYPDRFWYYVAIGIAWIIFTSISVAMVCVSAEYGALSFKDHDNIGLLIMGIFGVIFVAFSIGVVIGVCNTLLNGKGQLW